MTKSPQTVLVIEGTGAQGVPVIRALTHDGKYHVRCITRSLETAEAKAVAQLPHVTLFKRDSYEEEDFQKAFDGVQLAFVNTNGFAIGDKAEIYWGFAFDYGSKLGGFAQKYRCGHLDGKNKVTEYLKSQPTSPMACSVLSSCPYLEMLQTGGGWGPIKDDTGTCVFSVPLGDGAAPMIHLDDLGKYARWIFDNRSKSNGINLEAATCHVGLKDLTEVFQRVTGESAKIAHFTPEEYFARETPGLNPNVKLAHGSNTPNSTVMTFAKNFTGFHWVWRDRLAKRDYELLDKILPDRVKTLEEWMRKTKYVAGEFKPVLVDAKRGKFK